MAIDPNTAERKILDAAEAGEWARFEATEAREVGAAFLRAVLLGREIQREGSEGRNAKVLAPGLRVSGAKIGGKLDLAECAGLPGIALEECEFGAEIDCNHARLGRFSLKGSRIGEVRMRGADVDGAFDFSGVRSAGGEADGLVWIDAHGSKIGGGVEGGGAKLRAPKGQYALVLSDAVIEGSVRLRDGFAAVGGVNIGGSHIQADLNCVGAKMGDDKRLYAFFAQASRIDGYVLLNEMKAIGTVWMLGAKIGGTLSMSKAQLKNRKDDGSNSAFLCENAEIGGTAFLSDGFMAEGRVSLIGAKIGGSLLCIDGHFANRTATGKGVALDGTNAIIGGNVLLRDRFSAEGKVALHGAKIGGNLECDAGNFANRTENGDGDGLIAENAKIGGAVLFRNGFAAEGRVSLLGVKIGGNLQCDQGHFTNRTATGDGTALIAENAEVGGSVSFRNGFTAEGRVSLLGARIGGTLDCSKALLRNHGSGDAATTINLTNANIGRNALFNQLVSVGRVSFLGSRVGGDIDCTAATFAAWPPAAGIFRNWNSALDATNLSVGGDVKLDGAKVLGRLAFEHADIGGGLRWDGIRFPTFLEVEAPKFEDGKFGRETVKCGYAGFVPLDKKKPPEPPGGAENPAARIVLAHARIGAALQAYELAADVPLLIDLSAAQAYTLDDDKSRGGEIAGGAKFPEGWGNDGRRGKLMTKLDLDGFVYQRVEQFRGVGVSKGRRRWWYWEDFATPRIEWLERQFKPREGGFFPQPYRQLATVMRNQGHPAAARAVAIAENDATPHGFWGTIGRILFGFCFGYGLAPWRATRTLAAVLALGWAMVFWAQCNNVLVMTPDRVEALAAEQGSGAPLQPGVLKCGADEIQPVLYALDMALPVVPLHQEERCEIEEKAGTWWWQVAWVAFSIFGKVMTSLGLITYSGVLKPKDE